MEQANFDLLVRFQQSAGNADDWSSALASVARSFDADHIHVARLASAHGRSSFDTFGLDEALARNFKSQRASELWMPFEPAIPVGRPVVQEEIITDRLFERTDFYNEIVRPAGGFHSCNYRQQLGAQHHNITLCRKKSQKSFSEVERDRLGRLMPHVLTIQELHQRLAASELHVRTLSQALDVSNEYALLFDGEGRIQFANAKACSLLADPEEWISGARVKHIERQLPPQKLKEVIAVCLRSRLPVHWRFTVLSRTPIELPLIIDLMSRPAADLSSESRAIMFIRPLRGQFGFDRPGVMELFGLTPREGEVAEILAQGGAVSDIAVQTGIKESTVRFYLKQIFAKLGVANQAALVAALHPFRPH